MLMAQTIMSCSRAAVAMRRRNRGRWFPWQKEPLPLLFSLELLQPSQLLLLLLLPLLLLFTLLLLLELLLLLLLLLELLPLLPPLPPLLLLFTLLLLLLELLLLLLPELLVLLLPWPLLLLLLLPALLLAEAFSSSSLRSFFSSTASVCSLSFSSSSFSLSNATCSTGVTRHKGHTRELSPCSLASQVTCSPLCSRQKPEPAQL
jgi:hypothetical protein